MAKKAGKRPRPARQLHDGCAISVQAAGCEGAASVSVGAATSELREKGCILQALVEVQSDCVFIVSREGVVLDCRVPSETGFPASPEKVIGHRLADLVPPVLLEVLTGYLDKVLATGRAQVFCCQHVLFGESREFQVRAIPSGPDQVLAVARDVTERRVMAREILEISNREQMRIGQDLHDSLGQHLTGITFLARALENKLTARALPEAGEAAEIGRLVMQALSQTRTLARGLFPAELEKGGLAQALQDLVATAEKCFRISCRFVTDGTDVSDRNMAHHLLRIAQEAVSNAIRHGKAKEVVVELNTRQEKIELKVLDAGVGMQAPSGTRQGLGLRIMNYRAQKLRATLEIGPGPAGGTLVRCACPQPAPVELAA